jgi:hypothetical protein
VHVGPFQTLNCPQHILHQQRLLHLRTQYAGWGLSWDNEGCAAACCAWSGQKHKPHAQVGKRCWLHAWSGPCRSAVVLQLPAE